MKIKLNGNITHTHTHTHRCLTTGFLEREIPVTNFDGVNNASAADFKASM